MPPTLRILLTVVLFASGIGGAQAAVRTVNCGTSSSHPNIAAAIAAASSGDTISICPGTYSGAINVNKANLSFQSSTGNRNAVILTHSSDTFLLNAPDTIIRDLTIVSTNGEGIYGGGNGSHLFENLAITAHDNGIRITNSGQLTFRNLAINSATGNGIETTYNASGAHIFENVAITANREGIKLANGGPFLFSDVTVRSSNAIGILLEFNASGNHVFDNVEVTSQANAIQLNNGGTLTFTNIRIGSTGGSGISTSYNAAGAHSFSNVQIRAHNDGIDVANGGGLSFRDISITTSAGAGIKVGGRMSEPNEFENLDIAAHANAVDVGFGGKQSFQQVKLASATGNGILLSSNTIGAHTFEDIELTATREALYAVRGAALIRNADITSRESDGIKIGDQTAGVFENIKAQAYGHGFYIVNMNQGGVPPAHLMTGLELASSNASALHVGRSGKLTITNLKAESRGDAAHLTSDANGPHEIRNSTFVSTHGKGLYSHQGLSVLANVSIEAHDMATDVGNRYNVSFEGISASSNAATALNFNNNAGIGSSYTLKNVTVEKAGGGSSDGLFFHTATNTPSVSIDNICVRSAGRHGINFHYNAANVEVKNSIFRGQGQYAVYMGANPQYTNDVHNSCFYNAPCVYSNSFHGSPVHDFSGNYWGPGLASCSNSGNFNAGSPLSACPIPENVCYTSTIGAPPAPGGLNAFETDTPPGAVTGVIRTRIAGQAYSLAVVALNDAKDAVATGFVGDVKVEVLGNTETGVALDANNCPQSFTPLYETASTLTFAAGDNGRKTINLPAVPNAWRDVRIRLSYPATGEPTMVACSTDNFAVRPDALDVRARDANWETAGATRALDNSAVQGSVVHKAGRPFVITVRGASAGGGTTWNYNGTPTVKSLACSLPTPTCVSGSLNTGAWSGSGTVVTQTATYSEAGSFNLTLEDATFASVDNKPGDSSPAEYTIPQPAPISVGRFVPDHFTLSAAGTPSFRTFDHACAAPRSFTYIGQPFGYETAPSVMVTARNAAGGITRNYSLDLWKLDSNGITQTYDANMPRDADNIHAPHVYKASGNSGTGYVDVSTEDRLTFTRNPATPQAPFNAAISLTLSVSDASETTRTGVTGPNTIDAAEPIVFNGSGNGIAFDSGNAFRYGRLRLTNAHGSGLLDLPVPVSAQYWSGTTFIPNAADHCTLIDAGNIGLGNRLGGINNSNMTQSHVLPVQRLVGGEGRITLTKPGALSARGSVDLCVNLDSPDASGSTCPAPAAANMPWLKGAMTQPQQTENPAARASFGVYRGGPVIYLRELY